MSITYALEPELRLAEFQDVLLRSTLGARRPMDDPATLETMLRRADLIVTARQGERLVGISRALTDFAYCTYLSDLAVDQQYQRQGIGRMLIEKTHAAAGLHTQLVLIAAPLARGYYPHIGLQHHDSCWMIPRVEPPKSSSPDIRSSDSAG